MNRRLLISICLMLALLGLSAGAYQWFGAEPDRRSTQAAEAMQLWARADKSSEREHELKALESSLKQNPGHAPILLRMAQLSQEMGKTSDAIAYLRQAIKADPQNRDARLELGRVLFDTGDVTGAIHETEQLLDLDPSNIDGLYNLGAIYGNLGQEDRARQYWRKAAAINPDSESGRRAKDALKQIGG